MRRFAAHGLTQTTTLRGMRLYLSEHGERPAPTGLAIQPVEDEARMALWLEITLPVLGVPADHKEEYAGFLTKLTARTDIRFYLGLLHGDAVATAQLYLGRPEAGIYWVATIPEARRRGIGAAVTAAALKAAQAMDYSVAVLQSSHAGVGVYRTLGFREVSQLRLYRSTP